MFTVEHEFDLSKVTIMDENNNVDDFIIRFASDGIYFSQWVESENRHWTICINQKMFSEFLLALDKSEGMFITK
ncbi:hypothetical protein N9I00_01480 [bacterium]|nr:hypothetical protein [bacterium]